MMGFYYYIRNYGLGQVFEINVAGIKKENIEINVEDGYLIVNINHKDEFDKKEYNYLRKEMSYKTCRRKYYVGEIKEDQIKASLNDGILFISIPKEEDKNDKKTIIIYLFHFCVKLISL